MSLTVQFLISSKSANFSPLVLDHVEKNGHFSYFKYIVVHIIRCVMGRGSLFMLYLKKYFVNIRYFL